ncbi:hypothetical protein BH23CHL5_BH23CHL5_12360 [soil metagenome]
MSEESTSRFYELMVITSPEGTPEELVETVEQITGYITAAGGKIIRVSYDSPWGRRRLAYPIRFESQDVRDGFYTLFHLELEPTAVTDIERDLKLNTRLMRYLILVLPEMPTFPEPEVEEAAASDGEAAAESESAVDGKPAVEGEAKQTGETTDNGETAVGEAVTTDEANPADAQAEEVESSSQDAEVETEIDPEGSAESRRVSTPDSDHAENEVASADDPESGAEASKEV